MKGLTVLFMLVVYALGVSSGVQVGLMISRSVSAPIPEKQHCDKTNNVDPTPK